MSRQRLAASLAGALALMILAGGLAVRAFPLQAPPRDADSVTIRNAAGSLLHRPPLQYPREAREKRIAGPVVLEITVGEKGEVSDARVLSGPEELRRAAIENVLQWHYSRNMSLPAKLQVTVDFQLPPSPPPPTARRGLPEDSPSVAIRRDLGVIERIELRNLPPELDRAMRERLPVREGDTLTVQKLEEVKRVAAEVDGHLASTFAPTEKGVALVIFLNPEPTPVGGDRPKRIRVGGNVQAQNVVEKTPPVYPPLAKQARIQGVVTLTATIGADGRVKNLEVTSGHPLLVPASLEAVRQWVYKPTLLNGEPVEVITQIDVNFTLAGPPPPPPAP